MKLYACWGTFQTPRPGGHPCKNAFDALREAGHDPEVEKVFGLGLGPDVVTKLTAATPGRRHVEEMTGHRLVPVLELEDDTVIAGSKEIAAWAAANPVRAAA